MEQYKKMIEEILQADIDKAAKLFSQFKGKRVKLFAKNNAPYIKKDTGTSSAKPNEHAGILNYLGPSTFDTWGIQATLDRTPISDVDLDSIKLIEKDPLDITQENNMKTEDIVKKGYSYKNRKKVPEYPRAKITDRDGNKEVWKVVYGKNHEKTGRPIEQYQDEKGNTIYTDLATATKMQRAIILRGENVEIEKNADVLLDEDIVTHEELNPKIWNDDKIIKPEIRLKLLKIAKEFYENLELSAKIRDIKLLGSLASYNYTKYSDLDVHIVIKYEDINKDAELVSNYLWSLKNIWNLSHDIKISGYEVEMFIEDEGTPSINEGVFSLLNNEWVKEPKQKSIDVDVANVKQKADKYMEKIDAISRSFALSDETKDLEKLYKQADDLKEKIVQDRKDSLKTVDDIYGIENMVFKELRNNGYLEKITNLKIALYDAIHSLEQ